MTFAAVSNYYEQENKITFLEFGANFDLIMTSAFIQVLFVWFLRQGKYSFFNTEYDYFHKSN